MPVLAQNVRGRPSKQFDHWTDPDEYIGWDAIFALDDGGRANRVDGVRRHFDAVELVDAVELSLGTLPLRRVQLYACHNYRGPTREALLGAPLASSPGTRPPGRSKA